MIHNADDILRKYPRLSQTEAHRVVELLNRRPSTVRHIWEGEAQLTETTQGIGPDRLTLPMRALNSFADDNALPLPFPEGLKS